jgi:hypothetical protein
MFFLLFWYCCLGMGWSPECNFDYFIRQTYSYDFQIFQIFHHKKEIETNINLQLTCRKAIGFHSPTCTYMDRYFLLMESCPAFFVGERGHFRSKVQLVKPYIHKSKGTTITGATIKQHTGNLIARILTVTVIYFATEYGIKLATSSSSYKFVL